MPRTNAADYATALREWMPLAEHGDAGTQYFLGILYDNGRGVAQDYSQAVRWSRLAAEQGNADAQNNLGVMYVEGQGVAQAYIQAHLWFNLAATQGSAAGAAKNRDLVAGEMTADEVLKAQRLAREWMAKHEARQ